MDVAKARTAGLATVAAAVAVVVGALAFTGQGTEAEEPVGPTTPTATVTRPTETTATVSNGPSDVVLVQRRGRRLEVAGTSVPGRWEVAESRRDVWVAIKTAANGATSQWWGTGTTVHPMPPSLGRILRGGVVISQDARWIVWTRPKGRSDEKNPPRVMEVVDTATGNVRWSRPADADAPELGALAVTDDGVVVFAHCLEPVLDSGGWPQCNDARVDVWVPRLGVFGTVPAKVLASRAPFAGTVTGLTPLVRRTGAHNGLLVRSGRSARPQYVRVFARGDVEVVATLPRTTVAVTADERFALLARTCSDGLQGCGFTVLELDSGERRGIPSLADLLPTPPAPYYGYVVERDDLLVVQAPAGSFAAVGTVVARCSLAQALCVRVRE